MQMAMAAMILMSVLKELIAVIITVTTTLAATHAAVIQAIGSMLTASDAMVSKILVSVLQCYNVVLCRHS